MTLLARARVLVGTLLVRAGVRMLGVDTENRFSVDEDDPDEPLPAGTPTVRLSPTAARMVVEGARRESRDDEQQAAPLRGSLRERYERLSTHRTE